MSKKWKKSRRQPQHQSTESVQPQATPDDIGHNGGADMASVPDVPPTPTQTQDSTKSDNNKLSGWQIAERVMAITGLVLLLAYTFFAGGQWVAMNSGIKLTQRQLSDSESAQAARLVIENIQPTIVPGQFFDVDVQFTVRNVGPTVADDISENFRVESFNLETRQYEPSDVNQPAQPGQTGPSLGPGATRTYVEHSRGGDAIRGRLDKLADELASKYRINGANGGPSVPLQLRTPGDPVLSGKVLYMFNINVSYNDIFKRKPHITSDCLMYRAITKSFEPCPNMHQHQ
jgi:hypothetical protein